MHGTRLGDGVVDVGIVNGSIERIFRKIEQQAEREIEAGGRLLTPPFIESHVHLDTTLTAGESRWNESDTLFEGIRIWSERKKSVTREDVMDRATRLLRWQAAQGVLLVRTHVEITDPSLVALKAPLELKEEVRDWMDLQTVAFSQEGILSYPKGAELLEESIRMGADVVGAYPTTSILGRRGTTPSKRPFASRRSTTDP